MPILPSSRYADTPTVEAKLPDGRRVTALKLRRLPPTEGQPHEITGAERLDILSQRHYGDSTRFWHLADANSELEAGELAQTGRIISVPEQ